MGIEYRLTLSVPSPVTEVARRAVGDPGVPLTPYEHLLTADLNTSHGYSLSVGPVLDAYFEAVGDAGLQSWEVAKGVSITYAVTSDATWRARAQQNILISVAGVLATGPEDVTLIHNHDYLILTRVGGVVHKFRRDTWWAGVPQADAIIPG
ncbi:SitI3 family protein [Dactylosporangium siamense]|uniref:Uncharacterized protein n=1 Tax=Dactylosporangium siamense TaxID=685454 RepID=A0A919Q1Z3_9ACTN|nr:SitI3 family protein [Dactylosporangium siamense]GIG52400.1 hypothetical protein Dsi01nite_104410 [Dactylosporangium siamense]